MDEQRVTSGVAAVDRLGELHRLQRVNESGALAIGGGAEIGGRAHDDLLDQCGRREVAAVGVLVGLDHERRGT